ncbi:alanine--glyoxylate aminotransferase family protein [Synechococcus sp. PCC 7336]|uniref:pyridoxal-phosphate-dependent aminotransferase family protein n=1 Tax=Synechococcus sp. PCC 7336 TaxID=195250 RepID=UPI0003460B26|nr:alanine--glyoxylate aminotransferase family protein [Synechococcus sp. PCC 7336]
MKDKLQLMIPGPTPVPERALLAMAKHPIGHRSKAFSDTIAAVTAGLRWLHQTQNDVFILSASGTGAMEAGLVNVLSPGDRVLCGVNGKFGERWADMADVFGLQCERIESEWGTPYSVEAFAEKLQADTARAIKAVILTHSETSSGVQNDVEAIAKLAQEHGEALVIVDAVTSLGAASVPMDEWGLDIVASGSQKGYMMPPGLGFVAVSDRAMAATQTSTLPKYYWSFAMAKKNLSKNTTPFTPAVNLIYALQETLTMMQEEGLEAIFARHALLRDATRAGARALGLGLLAPDSHPSSAVTAIEAPAGINADDIRSLVMKKFDIALAAGQNQLKGKIFRIGHLGFICDRDILTTFAALESALREVGYEGFSPGAGVTAAARVLAG